MVKLYPKSKERRIDLRSMLLLLLLALSAGVYGQQSDKIAYFAVNSGSLTVALQNLQKETKVNLLYDVDDVKDKRTPAVEFRNEKVSDILTRILQKTDLVAEEKQGVFIIKSDRKPESSPKESNETSLLLDVRGTVKDAETGTGMAGVNVMIKGTSTGTVTDADGLYVLSGVGESAVLVFSMIGYQRVEEVVGNRAVIDITMQNDAEMLADVVVVGYGETNRSELTSSITTVAPKDFNRGVVGSPDQLLQGRVAGLNITRSGDPNGTPSVILRGASTLRTDRGAQEPFYVIDGIPGASLRLVSPDDIVSIDVLKDASATAIYGNRAANGVIMVTTRRAKPSYGLTYNGYMGVERVANKLDVMTGDELRDYMEKNGRSLDPRNDDYTLVGQDTAWTNTNWQDEIMRTGVSQNHTITYGGGTEKAVFNASVNYFRNEGIVRESDNERLIGKLSLEQKALQDRLTLTFQLTNSLLEQNLIQDGVFRQMVSYLPTVNVYNDDGSFKEETTVHTSNYFNPLGILKLNKENRKTNTIMGFAQARLDILDNLHFNINMTLQNETITGGLYQNSKSIYPISYTQRNGPTYSGSQVGGLGKRYSVTNTRKVLESYLQYDILATDVHNLKLMGGYSYQYDENNDGFQSSNYGFVSDATGSNNLGMGGVNSAVDYGNYIIEPLRLISFYSRVNYALNDKYLLQASFRRDGSSAFLGDNRWGNFPAVSAAWIINREDFLQDVSQIGSLKIRAGYGKTGNTIGFSPLYSVYRFGPATPFYANGGYTVAVGSVSNFNADLRWETTSMFNAGVDFALFNNKVSGSIDWYNKKTTDLMYEIPVSSTLFVWNRMLANFGEMSNKGVEITLNASPVQTGKFRWDLTAVWSHNKNEITKLSNGTYQVDSIATAEGSGAGVSGVFTQIIKERYPIGTFKLYQYAGRNENNISTFIRPDGTVTDQPRFPADAHIMGNAQPKFTYGLSNTFTYGNWSLNVFLRGVYGNDILNSTRAILSSVSQAHLRNIPTSAANEPYADIRNNEYSDRYLEKGSYLRLDNATLGYTIPFQNNYIKSARVYLTGQNLFVITDYSGIDPEVSLGGLTPGFDNNNFYPRTRSFLLGVTLDF
jgi:TonB-dependent starch-binding outer membrane protein SusC